MSDDEAEKIGSGAQYFDLTLPENNVDPKLLDLEVKYSEQDRYEDMANIAGALLFENPCDYQEHRVFLVKFLENNDSSYQKTLIHRECDEFHGYVQYKNNRNNFIHSMVELMMPKRNKEDIELAKKTILRGIELGLHPLEKDARFGQTPFALCLSNANTDLGWLNFFASLHPDSLTDLSEDKETAMQLVLRNNRKKEIVNWVVDELPLNAIQTNIDSIIKKKKTSSKASDAIEALTARLEQAQLKESIVMGSKRKAANKL